MKISLFQNFSFFLLRERPCESIIPYFNFLSVLPKQEDLLLTGIPNDYVEVGTDLHPTCTVSRIKPEASEMYWLVGRNRENGSLEQTNNDDGTFNQSNAFSYKYEFFSFGILNPDGKQD